MANKFSRIFGPDINDPNQQAKLEGLSQPFKQPDPELIQRLGSMVVPNTPTQSNGGKLPYSPTTGMGMTRAEGQLFDAARAGIQTPAATPSQMSDDYNVKMSALQAMANKAANPELAKKYYEQMNQLKNDKQSKEVDHDDLEEIK